MKFFFSLLALISVSAFGATPTSYVPSAASEFDFNRTLGPAAYKYSLGTQLRQAHNTAVGKLDYSVTGGAAGDLETGITLPNKAIVTKVFFDTVTPPASSSATDIAFKVQSSADLKALTAKGSWSGQQAGVPDGTVSNMIKLTAQRKVYATVSGAALTAGKIKVFVDYVVSE